VNFPPSTEAAPLPRNPVPHDVHPHTNWRAALRVLAAASAGPKNVPEYSDDDALTFIGFADADLTAKQATLGTLLATCARAFEDEQPCDWHTDPSSI